MMVSGRQLTYSHGGLSVPVARARWVVALRRFAALFVVAAFVQGCATTQNTAAVGKLQFSGGQPAIALMPLDVELSLLTATGLAEPRAEWTEAAKSHMSTTLNSFLATHEVKLVDGGGIQDDDLVDLLSLHEVVGNAILIHHYTLPLPTKAGRLDWTLGDEAVALRQALDADYGLFLFVRDSYSSGGRVALQILAAAAGVGVAGGMQVGFASLVDLRTGDIVWFNRLISGTGDLRELEPAQRTVANLLTGFPL